MEARQILIERLVPYLRFSYAQLDALVGGENVTKVTGTSGVEYFFQLCVEHVNECDPTIEVEGLVIEAKGRRWLPPTEKAGFVLSTSGQITSTGVEVMEAANQTSDGIVANRAEPSK